MANPVPPDVEAVVVAALLDDDGVTAAVGQRVYGARPAKATDPMLVVTRLGGPQTQDWIENARIQVDAWGTTRTDAFAAANAAAAALWRLSGTFTAGVVSGTARTLGPFRLDDPVTNRPRYIVEFTVFAHPLSA